MPALWPLDVGTITRIVRCCDASRAFDRGFYSVRICAGEKVGLVSRRMPIQKPGGSRQCYATPPEFIRAVEARFGWLDWDLAATDKNAVTECYFTKRENALMRPWISNERTIKKLPNRSPRWQFWLNPPYQHLAPWFAKCVKEQRRLSTGSILVLVPASVGANWFRNYVWNQANVFFLDGRLCFIPKEPYPKDLMLCVYRNVRRTVSMNIWDWRNNKLYKQRKNK